MRRRVSLRVLTSFTLFFVIIWVSRIFDQKQRGRFPKLPELEDRWRIWPPDLRYALCVPKIYVYPLPEHLRLSDSKLAKCRRWSPYSSPIHLLDILLDHSTISSLYLTYNPSEADFFLVPFDPACYLFHCWDSPTEGWNPERRCHVDEEYMLPILNHLVHQNPYWNVSNGANHIFVHPMDKRDHYYSLYARELMQKGIYFTTIGDRRSGGARESWDWRRNRDLVIPSTTYLIHGYWMRPRDWLDENGIPFRDPPGMKQSLMLERVEGGEGPEIYIPSSDIPPSENLLGKTTRRDTVAIFRGLGKDTPPNSTYSMGIRSHFFLSTSSDTPSEWQHQGFSSLPGFSILPDSDPQPTSSSIWQRLGSWVMGGLLITYPSAQHSYAHSLAHSKFGLLPPGHTLDTTRLTEYLSFGVVPVFLGTVTNGLVLPFEDDVDWREMGVFVGRDEAHELPEILDETMKLKRGNQGYDGMRKRVWEVGRGTVIEGRKGLVWHYIARGLCRLKGSTWEDRRIIGIPDYMPPAS